MLSIANGLLLLPFGNKPAMLFKLTSIPLATSLKNGNISGLIPSIWRAITISSFKSFSQILTFKLL